VSIGVGPAGNVKQVLLAKVIVLLGQIRGSVTVDAGLDLNILGHRVFTSDDQHFVGGDVLTVSELEARGEVMAEDLLYFEDFTLLVVGRLAGQTTRRIRIQTTRINHGNLTLFLGVVERGDILGVGGDVTGRPFTVEVLNLVALNAVLGSGGTNDLEHGAVHP